MYRLCLRKYINDGSVEENLKFIHIFSLKIMKELYHRLSVPYRYRGYKK